MRIHADVTVVGAGIIGLGAAYAAVRRGQRVVVIDRAEQPHGASIRNIGHLCFGAQTGTAREYANTSRGLWRRFARDAELWLRESGTSIVARHDDELTLLAAAASEGDIELWDQAETERHLPIVRGVAVGGARVQGDFQVDPRTALASIRRYLESQGVEFLSRTAVGAVTSGVVMTSRGRITSARVVVAVGHDIDALLPEIAAAHSIKRCTLDMLSARLSDLTLDAPLLTGWSLIRYGRFAGLPEAAVVRERLHTERPDLAALDLNQMYTQRPDGSVIIGDTHTRAADAWPFQTEHAFDALLTEATALFGTTPHVLQRWQGVYASGRDDFLAESPVPGVLALAATTGIGMTCGLGLAETHVAALLGDTRKEDN